ncbi:VOC family protein [Streptomyces sp. NPDC093018]|uniref:VOC family protein n=1 Tax=Streptomyces sp. NPDC093018 TaxID=3155067 RepID=UPI00343FD1A7
MSLIIDAVDPERLAAFWSEVLGRPIVGRTGPYVRLRRENDLGLGFQRASGAKGGKNRMHFDVSSADPEGNEFCVIPEGPFELDDEGRADYLSRPPVPPPSHARDAHA